MTAAVVSVSIVAVVALVALASQYVRAQRTVLRRQVLVSLDTGSAFRGLLWARRGRFLVLRDVQHLGANVEPVQMDGEVVVEQSRVEFVQAI